MATGQAERNPLPDRTAQALLNLRCAVDHCQDGVLIVDGNGVVDFVNPAFEKLMGYLGRELVGKELGPHISEGVEGWKNALAEAVRRGVYRGTLELRSRNGRAVELDVAMTTVRDYETRGASVVITAHDVGRERQLDAEIVEMRRMGTIGTLAGGMAHDFNNLLMVISAYAELGLQMVYYEHPLRRNLQEILTASRQAAELTRQILSSGGTQPATRHVLDLNSVIERTGHLLPRILGDDIELRLQLAAEPGKVNAEPNQVERVILNLATNARDAMPEGGILTITTECIANDPEFASKYPDVRASHYVKIAVKDTGRGIPESEMRKIFQPFYTTKTQQKGTGLGLATVERIVKDSAGFIAVHSELGKGTAFEIFLPRAAESQEDHPHFQEQEQQSAPRGHETMLLVEDDAAVRESTAEYLSSLGYQVHSAANCQEALAIARSHDLAFLITDVVMPHMSGPRLAEAVKELQPRIRVLFVSGHSREMLARKGLRDESALLQKPYPMTLLAERLRKELDGPQKVRAFAAGASV